MSRSGRQHLSIALGRGSEGEEARRRLEAAAGHAGMKVSAWCRRVLIEQAGLASDGFVTRGEFEMLVARIDALEGATRA